MPFRFKRKESVADAVRRLGSERLDEALRPLDRGAGLDGVHVARKEIKKLRAVLRLVRAGIGEMVYGEVTSLLHEAADRLNAMRDAQVRLAAWDELTRHFNGRFPAQTEIRSALRDHCRTEERKLGSSLPALKMDLLKSKERFNQLEVKPNGWKAIAPGLEKIYRRGRKAFEVARCKPSPKNFHEWRKRVKDLGHELRLLCPAGPRSLRERREALNKLGDLLGEDHDLFLLVEFIAKKFRPEGAAQALERCLGARQEKLRAAALEAGASFYSEKPRRFRGRIEKGWKSGSGSSEAGI